MKTFFLSLLFLTFVAFLATNAIASEALLLSSCQNCHNPQGEKLPYLFSSKETFVSEKPLGKQCVKCHASLNVLAKENKEISWATPFNGEMIQRFAEHKSYGQIPSLGKFKKYSECGLRKFLHAPVSRRFNAHESMFPLLEKESEKLFLENKLEKCVSFLDDQKLLNKGKTLYKTHSCVSCHSPQGEGPKLRIGVPLLSFSFFEQTLKKNKRHMNREWALDLHKKMLTQKVAQIKQPMPAFQLTSEERKALYVYLSSSTEDLEMENATVVKGQNNGLYGKQLYDRVVKNVFTKSCQHCHSGEVQTKRDNQHLFGERFNGASDLAFPTQTKEALKTRRLFEVLSPGKRCEDATIVTVLLERHNEWQGKKNNELRGMPLTGKPLSMSSITELRNWTRQGCPTGKEFLCKPCKM